jgi:hypothetical protein
MCNLTYTTIGVWKIGLPVRSAVVKPYAGELVAGQVTTSKSLLLYVVCCMFLFLFLFLFWFYFD